MTMGRVALASPAPAYRDPVPSTDWRDIRSLDDEELSDLLDIITDPELQKNIAADDPRAYIVHDLDAQARVRKEARWRD